MTIPFAVDFGVSRRASRRTLAIMEASAMIGIFSSPLMMVS